MLESLLVRFVKFATLFVERKLKMHLESFDSIPTQTPTGFMKRITLLAALLLLSVGCSKSSSTPGAGSNGGSDSKPRVAYVTNGVDPFWVVAEAGVNAGAEEFDADAEVMTMTPKWPMLTMPMPRYES